MTVCRSVLFYAEPLDHVSKLAWQLAEHSQRVGHGGARVLIDKTSPVHRGDVKQSLLDVFESV